MDVRSIDFTVRMLFGIYPIFEIGHAEGGGMELNIHHRLKLFGEWREAKVALVDISYSEWGGSRLPNAAPVYVNTLSTDMRERRHTIIPAPLLTFAFSGTLF